MAFAAHMYYLRNRRREDIRNFNVSRRALRDAADPFQLRELEFQRLFRVDRETARFLINRLGLPRQRRSGISPHMKVLVTLRFLGYGSYQRAVGQGFLIAMSQPSVSNCIRATTRAIYEEFLEEVIHFPSTRREREQVSTRFQEKAGFPGILGCIDCTHVAIVTPWQNPEAYKNHHGFFSLNVQLVSDLDLRIVNINANFPGSVHDNFIFNNSVLKNEMERLHTNRLGSFYLIGDSGYALRNYLLTPILNAEPGSPEDHYTRRHCQVRNVIERLNGILKARWRCLRRDRTLHYQPRAAAYIIYSCAILHNMLLGRVPMPEPEVFPHPQVDNEAPQLNNDHVDGERTRNYIVQTYFNN